MAKGDVSFPGYMESTHKNWLRGNTVPSGTGVNTSINDLINIAHTDAGNPYHGETAFDPDAVLTFTSGSPLDKVSDQYEALSTVVSTLNAAGYFNDFPDVEIFDDLAVEMGKALTELDTILASSAITDIVTAFENSKKPRFLREMGMWTAGMADLNAVHTSSFVLGMGLMQSEFSKIVDAFEAELKLKTFNSAVADSINTYLKAKAAQIMTKGDLTSKGPEIYSMLSGVKKEIELFFMLAKREQANYQLNLDKNEAKWDFEAFMYANSSMASISGAPSGREGPNDGQIILGSAATGAAIGAEFGIPGAIIGAGVGTGMGYLSTL